MQRDGQVKVKAVICAAIMLAAAARGELNAAGDLTVRYVPVGDSYTIGTGVGPAEIWPILLVGHLQAEGIDIEMVANPARGGWTAAMALEKELPAFRSSKPTFATLMIGANDVMQGVTEKDFRRDLGRLMDGMKKELPYRNRFIVINIPEFSCTPAGQKWAQERPDLSTQIARFNLIVWQEAAKRELKFVDINTISRQMCQDPSLTGEDGLHPSYAGHLIFQETVYKVARPLF